ncbi:C-type lectin domain family 2 member D-like isoform X1 [Lepidochelys kempii]|uniref:C-type lectin domain family 2 member D-like isoform X1 n=1 Tax=Lepidochelys kempii TaxID=8472 RepID=UPI003C6ED51E
MGPAAGPAESKEPLQEWPVEGKGHLETGGEPDPHRNCRKCNYKKGTIVLAVALVTMFLVLIIVLAVWRPKLPSADLGLLAGPACPDGWIVYQGKRYYFSEAERNWTYSLTYCSALSASLAEINSEQEMAFLLRYKGGFDHWIGLRRDPGQLWKWANGTKFNNLFPIRGGGECAYLNDENEVSSLRCTSERHWICTKPDAFTQAQEAAVVGGS